VAIPNNHRLPALVPRLPSVVISYNSSGIYLGQALGGLLLTHAASTTTVCLVGAGLGPGALVAIAGLNRPDWT